MTIQQLERLSVSIRQNIITMLEEAGSGHTAGALGLADIFTVLYFHVLRHRPDQPEWPERDRLILSCGHTNPVLYATLAEAGYYPRAELLTLRKMGSRLQGHPHNRALPGIETSSGPLGQGLSQAIGMALAAEMDRSSSRVYAVLSDGEHQEGQTWEAIMFAGNRRLKNLVVTIDRNHIQIDGPTENIMPLEPLADKYRAFNWQVLEVAGNDIAALIQAYASVWETDQPVCIIAQTVPGKGVSFMENDYRWHGTPPNTEQAERASEELCRTIRI